MNYCVQSACVGPKVHVVFTQLLRRVTCHLKSISLASSTRLTTTMPSLSVSVKHAGKTYADLPLDTSLPGLNFKQTVYEKTGVPVDRMKVMVKGGILKDDGDWAKIAPKDVSPAVARVHPKTHGILGSNIHGYWRCRRASKSPREKDYLRRR